MILTRAILYLLPVSSSSVSKPWSFAFPSTACRYLINHEHREKYIPMLLRSTEPTRYMMVRMGRSRISTFRHIRLSSSSVRFGGEGSRASRFSAGTPEDGDAERSSNTSITAFSTLPSCERRFALASDIARRSGPGERVVQGNSCVVLGAPLE